MRGFLLGIRTTKNQVNAFSDRIRQTMADPGPDQIPSHLTYKSKEEAPAKSHDAPSPGNRENTCERIERVKQMRYAEDDRRTENTRSKAYTFERVGLAKLGIHARLKIPTKEGFFTKSGN